MKKTAVSSLFAVTFLFAVPSYAQNLLSIEGTKQFSLVGSLGEGQDFIGDDAWALYPTLSLYDTVDISCPVENESSCLGSLSSSEFRLDIPHSLQYAYWKLKGSTAYVTGTISGSPPVDGVYTLSVSALAEVKVETGLEPGIYAKDKRYCQAINSYLSDDFAQIVVGADGSFGLEAWENSCKALSSSVSQNTGSLTLGCFSEGMASTEPATIRPLQADEFEFGWAFTQAGRYSLCSDDDQGLYLSAAPDLEVDLRRPHADEISYGSRIGMTAALIELSGVDTDRAKLVAQIMPIHAYEFCAFYVHQLEADCINEAIVTLAEASFADCSSGIFTNIWGNRRQFKGLSSQDDFDDFSIVDLVSGEDITGSIPEGYYSDIELFETLCPSVAAELLAQPLARQKLAMNTYADAFRELDYWRGINIGARDQNQRRLDDLPIWQFATRMRPAVSGRVLDLLSQTRLVTDGHFGFAAISSDEGASLLVDFARQELYVCALLLDADRPVSYRFGTALARGIDGFGAACPDTLYSALLEYIPLIDESQAVVSAQGETNFSSPPFSREEGSDFLGLGAVLAEYQCPELLAEDDPRRWWYKYSGNWLFEGNLGPLICRVEEAKYSPAEGGIAIVEACGGSGWGFSLREWTIPRPPKNPQATYFWGETPMKQCSTDFLSLHSENPPRNFPIVENIYTRNGMQSWADIRTGAVYRVGNYSFSFYTTADTDDSQEVLNVAVSQDGRPTASINLPTAFGGTGAFGVYFMGEDAVPTLVVASYAGGAHCCTDYAFLPLTPEPSEVSVAGSFDGDYFDLWDIDRDGSFELARPDIRFPHAIGSRSGSWAPPIIYAMQDGVITDATNSERYRLFLREEIERISEQCGVDGGWEVGACEGWAATALRLGEYNDAMAVIAKRFAAAPKTTTMGATSFDAFSQELSNILTELGLHPVPTPVPDRLSCSFSISRRIDGEDISKEIAKGNFYVVEGKVVGLTGAWDTLGQSTDSGFADSDLYFTPAGGLYGELTIYPLYARSAEIPPSSRVILDGKSTISFGGGAEGATKVAIDRHNLEITVTVFPCVDQPH